MQGNLESPSQAQYAVQVRDRPLPRGGHRGAAPGARRSPPGTGPWARALPGDKQGAGPMGLGSTLSGVWEGVPGVVRNVESIFDNYGPQRNMWIRWQAW